MLSLDLKERKRDQDNDMVAAQLWRTVTRERCKPCFLSTSRSTGSIINGLIMKPWQLEASQTTWKDSNPNTKGSIS